MKTTHWITKSYAAMLCDHKVVMVSKIGPDLHFQIMDVPDERLVWRKKQFLRDAGWALRYKRATSYGTCGFGYDSNGGQWNADRGLDDFLFNIGRLRDDGDTLLSWITKDEGREESFTIHDRRFHL